MATTPTEVAVASDGTLAPINILAFGDSLTAGYHRVGINIEFSPYATTLEATLRAALPGREVNVDAVGFSGYTTKQLVNTIDADSAEDVVGVELPGFSKALSRRRYSVALIMAGTNDLGGKDPDATLAQLRRLHQHAIDAGLRTVAITVPQSKASFSWDDIKAAWKAVNAGLPAFAAEGTTLFVDMAPEVPVYDSDGEDTPFYDHDGLHMSPGGYARFGAALGAKITDFVAL